MRDVIKDAVKELVQSFPKDTKVKLVENAHIGVMCVPLGGPSKGVTYIISEKNNKAVVRYFKEEA